MACVLTVGRATTDLAIPLSSNGRLVGHLANGNSVEFENFPNQPSDVGGEWAIYREAVRAFTVPFTCASSATKSTGKLGGGSAAGAADAAISCAGAFVGRLF